MFLKTEMAVFRKRSSKLGELFEKYVRVCFVFYLIDFKIIFSSESLLVFDLHAVLHSSS